MSIATRFKLQEPTAGIYIPENNTYRIPLQNEGLFAIVDAADYERVKYWKWTAIKGKSAGMWYAARWTKDPNMPSRRIKIAMHRFILGDLYYQIDHRDGNGLNNSRLNLRNASNHQNGYNRPVQKSSSTKIKGIWPYGEKGQFQAAITIAGKRIHLGTFSNMEDAGAAYRQAADKYHGEFSFNKCRVTQPVIPQSYCQPCAGTGVRNAGMDGNMDNCPFCK